MANDQLLMSSIYLAGVLSFFSPCIFPVIPVYISIISDASKKSIARTLMFVLGLSITFLVLGFGAGLLGEIFFSDKVRITGGIIVVIMGLFQMEILKLKFLEKTKTVKIETKRQSIFTPFVLGLTFSLGWTPCVGPVLASILFISGSSADVSKSLLMMFVYMLGMATPFVIFSLASEVVLKKVNFIKKYLVTMKKFGGLLIVIMGILLIFNKLNIFAQL